jgi:DNA-binding XRE family transcriptional regulator
METLTETPLRRILREEGRKQSWLAAQIGVNKTQMSNWSRGLYCPPDKQVAIAKALGRKVNEVFPK